MQARYDFYPETTAWDGDVHQEFEFGMVLGGQQERRSGLLIGADGNECERIGAGDVWFTAMWEPHWWRVVAPGTSEICLQFAAEYLGTEKVARHFWFELFAAPPPARPRVTSPSLRKVVLAFGNDMGEQAKQRRAGWEQAVRLDLLRVMLELALHWGPPGGPASGRSARRFALGEIMPALTLVTSRLPSRVHLLEAVRMCGMSRASFCSVFKQSMGVTFARFELRARLAWVSRQLASDDDPIASIAARASFADESHLHRTFVRHYGCTPRQFRLASANRPLRH